MITKGAYEPQNIRSMSKLIKEGDTLLNIGAHIGTEMIVLGKLLGPNGKIYFFEPYPSSYSILVKNTYINGLHDISTFYQVAVSNIKQKGYIVVEFINTSASQIYTEETLVKNQIRYNEKLEISIDLVDNVLPKDV